MPVARPDRQGAWPGLVPQACGVHGPDRPGGGLAAGPVPERSAGGPVRAAAL